MSGVRRRDLLIATALAWVESRLAKAGIIAGKLPWRPNEAEPPPAVRPGPWKTFTAAEAAMVEVLADRIIPPDPQTPGGKDAGCAVFIDRQLAGPYGRREGLYVQGPFTKGTPQQGDQSALTPVQLYRAGLAALDRYCRANRRGQPFVQLSAEQQDEILLGLEKGSIALEGVDGKIFFEQVIKNVQEGFFADPLYGGNRDMSAWKMIGFPGARYDYRDWVSHHNEPYPLPPVGIQGRADWIPKRS